VIHPLAIVADKAQIVGSHPVEIGEQSVLHPHCRIRADHGPVKIGKRCIIQEAATVGAGGGGSDIHIGNGVNVEAGAVVEAKSIGDGTLIEAKAKIGKGAVIGKVGRLSRSSAG
jgi:dynactin-6